MPNMEAKGQHSDSHLALFVAAALAFFWLRRKKNKAAAAVHPQAMMPAAISMPILNDQVVGYDSVSRSFEVVLHLQNRNRVPVTASISSLSAQVELMPGKGSSVYILGHSAGMQHITLPPMSQDMVRISIPISNNFPPLHNTGNRLGVYGTLYANGSQIPIKIIV